MRYNEQDYLDVLVLAAGKSKRMGGQLSKVLLPLADRRVIDYILEQVTSLNSRKIGIVIGFTAERVREYLAGRPLVFIEQTEQRGTGHAVLVSESHFGDTKGNLLVLNGDVPLLSGETLRNFITSHFEQHAPMSLMTAILPDPTGYGRIIRGREDTVMAIIEEKDATEEERAIKEINAGIYLFKKEYLFPFLRSLTCENKAGEYYLTDVVSQLTAHSLFPRAFIVSDHREVLGINTPDEYSHIRDLCEKDQQKEEKEHYETGE